MNAIEKLNNEKANVKTTADKKIIDALVARCKQNKALCDDVMNEKKSLKNCFKYIVDKARENCKATGRSGYFYIDDEEVYEIAEDYFHAQNLEIDNPKPKPEPQKFDKDKAIAKATAKPTPKKATSQKKAIVMEMPKKSAPKPTPKPSAPKAVATKPEEQFSLFDFM